MSRSARTPFGVLDTAWTFLAWTASRIAPEGTASFTPPGGSCVIRLRPSPYVLACVLGSALSNFAVAADSHAQTRIGRLFASPEQRIELDRLRSESDEGRNAEPVVERTGGEFRPEPERGPSVFPVTFNGIVVRGDGHRVAWIDGVEAAVGETTPTGVRVDSDHDFGGRIRIRLSHGRTIVALEPGQFVDDGGRTHEAYERRSGPTAGGFAHERAIDSDGGAETVDAATSADSRRPILPVERPAKVLEALPQEMRIGTALLRTKRPDVQPAGDEMRERGNPDKPVSGR